MGRRIAAVAMAAAAVLAGCSGSDDAATDAGTPTVAAGGDCPNEPALTVYRVFTFADGRLRPVAGSSSPRPPPAIPIGGGPSIAGSSP